jgi:ATP-binding cassette subfamily B protein
MAQSTKTHARNAHPLTRLLAYTKNYRKQVIMGTIFSVLNKIFDLAPPALIGGAVDIVTRREDSFLSAFGFTDVSQQLWVLAGLTLFIWVMESVFEYIHKLYWRNLSQNIEHELRIEAYAHVQDLEMAYFEDQSTGGLMSILNDDINQLERFLDIGANELIQVTATVLIISAGYVIVAPSVAWVALVPVPIIIYGSVWFQKKLTAKYSKVREQVGFLNHQLANNLGGIATIKSFTNEGREIERMTVESNAYKQANHEAILLSAAFVPLIRMVIVGGFIAIMVFGGQMALDGVLNVGLYSVMVFMTQRLLWPLTRLGETFDLYQRAMASTRRILDLLDVQPQIVDGPQRLPIQQVQGAITFKDVRFGYKDGGEVIHGLSLNIPAGNTIAIVGATGAGKSTVVKLLLRLYDITAGSITLDGHELRDLNLNDLRGSIGLVSQDVFLFHGTVRENILYGNPDATNEQVQEAAKIAEAHDFIMKLPQGYDTIVGERGQKLSGGQRQRISIARAVLKNPPVLILDEATSAVDNETEAAIQRSLDKLAVGRTTIVIAHRLSTVRNAHQIFVLSEGALYENGTHDELVAKDGIYHALWRVQTGERAKAGD